MARVLICGVGNKLKQDDGLGPFVVEELEKVRLPENVEVADFGISGFKCALSIEGYDKVVFVDAISLPGEKPGRLYRIKLDRDQLLGSPNLSSFSISLHETDLEKILATAAVLGIYPPHVVIIGCQPEETNVALGLTPVVKKSVPKIIELVMDEVGRGL